MIDVVIQASQLDLVELKTDTGDLLDVAQLFKIGSAGFVPKKLDLVSNTLSGCHVCFRWLVA